MVTWSPGVTDVATGPLHPEVELAGLDLTALRAYRDGLRSEESMLSGWRQVVRSGLESTGALAPLRSRPAGTAVVRWPLSAPWLLDLPTCAGLPRRAELLAMWAALCTTEGPHEQALVAARLWAAERQLSDHRLLVHARLDLATTELVSRFRERPRSALAALTERLPAAPGH